MYNKLVEFSRKIFFYEDIKLEDTAETRVYLIFFHFSIILKVFKVKSYSNFPQNIYDNMFQNIEYHLRELGLGDVSVNKKMKVLNQCFYDILLKIDQNSKSDNFNFNIGLFEYYLCKNSKLNNSKREIVSNYFENYYKICFELKSESMIEGHINY